MAPKPQLEHGWCWDAAGRDEVATGHTASSLGGVELERLLPGHGGEQQFRVKIIVDLA